VIIVNAEVDGVPGLDVLVDAHRVLAVGPRLARHGEQVLDARGGAVLPGLHDHHVHIRAAVAAAGSLRLDTVATPAEFDTAIRGAASGVGWLRGVGWHESTAGEVDRHRLDALAPATPVRLQHRSGALWALNSVALRTIGAFDATEPGVHRDADGQPTGLLWRLDRWLRDRVDDPAPHDVRRWSRTVARYGITGLTDATPDRTQRDVADIAALVGDGSLAQSVALMAPPAVPAVPGVTVQHTKFVLDDPTLPDVADLARSFADCHAHGRTVAVHCVTADQLVVAVAACEQAGVRAGDRIEHAGVVPPGYAGRLGGLAVVTQPGFLAARGDDYLRDVPAAEQPWLYPVASLLRAGVPVAASTDAPFGPADPWVAITAAIHRRTRGGTVLGAGERVAPRTALDLWLADPADLRRTRQVVPGERPDLCVLHVPLADALRVATHDVVAAVVIGGHRVG
jgi:predicted amidohydrolase YtcJ